MFCKNGVNYEKVFCNHYLWYDVFPNVILFIYIYIVFVCVCVCVCVWGGGGGGVRFCKPGISVDNRMFKNSW